MIKNQNQKIINKLLTDKVFRLDLVRKSHYWFFNLYMSHYVTVKTALFQRELFKLTEDTNNKMAVIVAFRGSAKSTIMSFSYPIWAIMGKLQKKHVLLISQTQAKAQGMLQSIKSELESNTLLKGDLGPFKEEPSQWGSQALVLTKFNARIATASVEQSVRGTKHNQYRPDLIIIDDIEDIQSVKTKEGRDKTFNWLMGEVLPAGDSNTNFVIIGNLLHKDSVIKRLENRINDKQIKGVYKEYPLMDENNNTLWLSKYPTPESIEELKNMFDSVTFHREYMLKILPSDDQVVREDWIQYYNCLPEGNYRYEKIGVDLAISLKDTADYTAVVSARAYGYEKNMKIYILPQIINKRLNFPEAVSEIKQYYSMVGKGSSSTTILIEDVAYQISFAQHMQQEGYPCKGVKIGGTDKLSRLTSVTYLIQNGTILFPKDSAKELIQQMVGFGIEKHDDLVDAFTLLIQELVTLNRSGAIAIVGGVRM